MHQKIRGVVVLCRSCIPENLINISLKSAYVVKIEIKVLAYCVYAPLLSSILPCTALLDRDLKQALRKILIISDILSMSGVGNNVSANDTLWWDNGGKLFKIDKYPGFRVLGDLTRFVKIKAKLTRCYKT